MISRFFKYLKLLFSSEKKEVIKEPQQIVIPPLEPAPRNTPILPNSLKGIILKNTPSVKLVEFFFQRAMKASDEYKDKKEHATDALFVLFPFLLKSIQPQNEEEQKLKDRMNKDARSLKTRFDRQNPKTTHGS